MGATIFLYTTQFGNFRSEKHVLRTLTGKIHPHIKLKRLGKVQVLIWIWVVGTLNQQFIRGSYA